MAALLRRQRKRRVPFSSDEWCRLFRDVAHGVPGTDGATARFEVTVVGPTGGPRSFTAHLVDGVMTDVVCGPEPDADLHAEFPRDQFVNYLRGDSRIVYDAYWNGGITVTGELDAVVAIAALLDSPEFKAQLRSVHDQTDFA